MSSQLLASPAPNAHVAERSALVRDLVLRLVGRADTALYEAKRLGRNRVCIGSLAPDDTWR